ncbi:unnamed protein product [Owenia fusiformis]|uniref:Uncharacterized protein n=1 Tax=Owenia fusiformis TaxID=6347 RepID=A0A8J1UAH0_OWEFU|nr:unnamed protein product [Owenia fusiformis]
MTANKKKIAQNGIFTNVDYMEFVIGGAASCGAVCFSNPLETVKTRMQLQGELKAKGHYAVTYRNVFDAFIKIGRHEGLRSLQKGLSPALAYQLSLNGTRRGIYQAIVSAGFVETKPGGGTNLWASTMAGGVAGCISACISSPWFMFKTQFQSEAASAIAVGHQRHYASLRQAVAQVVREQGFKGLYRGATGITIRVTCGSAAEMPSFALTKEFLDKYQIMAKGTFMNAAVSSIISGIAVTVAMCPFDVVTTRLYNQGLDAKGKGLLYDNFFDCVWKILKQEGPFGFYKGFGALLFRLGPHTLLSLMLWDAMRVRYNRYKLRDLPSEEIKVKI